MAKQPLPPCLTASRPSTVVRHLHNLSRKCLAIYVVRMSTPLFVILITLLPTLTWIDFMSTFLSRGTSLLATASHAQHTTWNVLLTNQDNRAKTCDYKSGSCTSRTSHPSKLGGKMFPSLGHQPRHLKTIYIMIHYCYCLMASGRRKAKYMVQEDKHLLFIVVKNLKPQEILFII